MTRGNTGQEETWEGDPDTQGVGTCRQAEENAVGAERCWLRGHGGHHHLPWAPAEQPPPAFP